MEKSYTIAVHEAGHIFANLMCYGNLQHFSGVTIIPEGGALGKTSLSLLDSVSVDNKENSDLLLNEVSTLLAGAVAVEVITGKKQTFNPLSTNGMDIIQVERLLSNAGINLASSDGKAIVRVCKLMLNVSFRENAEALEALASALYESKTLTKEEVFDIIDFYPTNFRYFRY